ncbi:EscE/YscE/SsaE family type III secretion system needle protein co-chaperone [Thiofilum flexile]|uniref:EscE/YscE/SsaE family type III secretion system needle protein co-chaperone n=1 Tax=Thiofilum flexile TaxID=125627 RepID=UPI00035CA5D8|nr:EscE/YscE/SsaE family type III secretion system needle protein co-chaperone [Thiofilum flexile]
MPLQIEESLKNDVSGVYKNELLEKFHQASSQIRMEINQGVDPVEYNKLDKLLRAIEASSEVVEQVWGQR